jgi:four helix bundle protein
VGKISSYKELRVWQAAMDVAALVYHLTEKFPAHHRYGIAQQMQRAAVSVVSNIAEGHSRRASKEFIYFLRMAQGSVAELEVQAMLSERVGLLGAADCEKVTSMTTSISKMLYVMITKIQPAANSQ